MRHPGETGLAIIEAELATPEVREWRVVVDYGKPNGKREYFQDTKASAESFAEWCGSNRPLVIESRVPAGPWEPTL